MEHLNIISQEAITRGLIWPPVVIGIFAILIMFTFVILSFVKKDLDLCVKGFIIALALYPVMLLSMLVCNKCFPEETGRYKYTATLDPEMTITEFEEFQQTYDDIRCEDGVWYFEDKEN